MTRLGDVSYSWPVRPRLAASALRGGNCDDTPRRGGGHSHGPVPVTESMGGHSLVTPCSVPGIGIRLIQVDDLGGTA